MIGGEAEGIAVVPDIEGGEGYYAGNGHCLKRSISAPCGNGRECDCNDCCEEEACGLHFNIDRRLC